MSKLLQVHIAGTTAVGAILHVERYHKVTYNTHAECYM